MEYNGLTYLPESEDPSLTIKTADRVAMELERFLIGARREILLCRLSLG